MRISHKHGVNPSLSLCFFCGEEKNEIVLAGAMKGDAEAPRQAVWNYEPCDKCAEHMKQGIMLINVSNNGEWRTGKMVVLKEEAVRRIFFGDVVEEVLKKRCAFVDQETWNAIGLT